MTAFARMVAGSWVEIVGPFTAGAGNAAVQYPAGWLDGATPEQLADLGVAAIVDEPPPAASLQLTGQALVDVDGVPHRRWVMPPLADLRTARRAELAAIRWDRQQTMKWRGRIVDASDVIAGRIVGAVMRAQVTGDQTVTIRWKFGDDDFDTLTLADLTAYGIAVGAHLQGCFDREAELVQAIGGAVDAATVAALDLATGWPA